LVELLKSELNWRGEHVHGQFGMTVITNILSIWAHIDLGHRLDNFLLGAWVMVCMRQTAPFRWCIIWSFCLAIGLTFFEELVHLWRALPDSCGSSGWIVAHLPFCFFVAYKSERWKKLSWYGPMLILVGLEFLLFPYLKGTSFGPSDFYHLIGLCWGVIFLGLSQLLRVGDFTFKRS